MPVNTDLITTYSNSLNQTSRAGNTTTETSPEDNTSLSMQDFYELLAAQMKYQDPSNPTSTADMMAQMAQTETIVATQQLISSINQMSQINLITYSSSMLGKEVRVALKDDDGVYTGDDLVGVVEGVALYNGTPQIYIDGEPYELAQLMGIGEVPAPPKDDETDGTENGDGTSDGTTNETEKGETTI